MNLILCDGATLRAPWGITVNAGTDLTIWAQSKGGAKGALIADCSRIFWEDPVSVERLSGSGPELIPFREAVEIAQTILYEADKDRTVSITDTVESIALTMLIESDPETDGTGKLIPAWEVCFTKTMGSQGVSRGLQSIFIRADTGEALVWTAGVFCRDAACATGLDRVPAVLGNYKVAE